MIDVHVNVQILFQLLSCYLVSSPCSLLFKLLRFIYFNKPLLGLTLLALIEALVSLFEGLEVIVILFFSLLEGRVEVFGFLLFILAAG